MPGCTTPNVRYKCLDVQSNVRYKCLDVQPQTSDINACTYNPNVRYKCLDVQPKRQI